MKKGLMTFGALAALAVLTCSCVSPAPADSSRASSQDYSTASSGEASSAMDSLDSIDSSEPGESTYTVYFCDPNGQVYSFVTVDAGSPVTRPEDPEMENMRFVGWFTKDGQEYDFSNPVYGNLSLFARFEDPSYFAGYDPKYQPTVSALACSDVFIEGQKDVTFRLSAKNVNFMEETDVEMVRLSGAFANLNVESIEKVDNKLRISTSGTVGEGKGIVCLAKELTDIGIFLTASCPIVDVDQILDRTSFGFAEDRTYVDFGTWLPSGMSLRNDESLGKDDFMAKVNSGEYAYLSVANAQGYSVQMLELADDFASFRLRLTLPRALDDALFEEMANTMRIHIAPEAVTGNIAIDFPVDLLNPITKTTIQMYRKNGDINQGYFTVKFLSSHLNSAFKDRIDSFLVDPANKNFIITFPGVDTTITALSAKDDVTLNGEFTVPSSLGDDAKATVSFPTLKNPDDGSDMPIAIDFIDGSAAVLEPETHTVSLDQSLAPGGGTGTVTQSSAQSYREIKSSVEQSAFSMKPEGDYDAAAIVKAATNIGKIGFGLYSGNFSLAKDAAVALFGLEGLADPSDQILSALASIASKLQEIEAKIDSIANQLQTIQAELEQLGKQSLLTNYLTANSRWNDFLTAYYVPLKDSIVSYSNDYFRYYYNLAIDSYDPFPGQEPTVTLYYDRTGNLAFPGRNPSLSIDGKSIDKAATKTVTIPVLNYSLGGIFANGGHVYSTIEEDVIADLFAYGIYDEDLIVDIVSTIRYNAMQNHFSAPALLDEFNLTFTNFCAAFTASELGPASQSSLTPLDAYRIMLETIYNFGFEIEPEFNLTAVRLESIYYCARSILEYTKFINSGEIVSSRYDDLDKAVQTELTDNRFYHSNVDATTVYCFAAGCYTKFTCDAFGINIYWDTEYGHGITQLDYYLTRRDTFTNDNYDPLPGLSSIDETSIRFMALKVRLYNSLKGTNVDFRTYLAQVGIIPKDKVDATLGIILSQDTYTTNDDEIGGIRFPANWYINTGSNECVAFKGRAYSFADGDFVNGLCAFAWDWSADQLGGIAYVRNLTNVGIQSCPHGNPHQLGVYAYYVNFTPVNV